MKKILSTFIIFVSFLFYSLSCHKDGGKPINSCGCLQDTIVSYATYNNFLRLSYDGFLNYISEGTNPGWYVGIHIPNTNYASICKICNPDMPAIKAFTDTSSKSTLDQFI